MPLDGCFKFAGREVLFSIGKRGAARAGRVVFVTVQLVNSVRTIIGERASVE